MKAFTVAAAVAATSISLTACATSYSVTPIAGQGQSIRYLQGQPTTFAEGANGSIQITPLGVNEKGRLSFGVAAFNSGEQSSNFGVENMTAEAGGEPLRIFTYAEMERMAKTDAAIATLAVALAGAASAYAASSGPTYTSTMTTPRGGVYRYTATNHAAQAALVGAAAAGTAYSVKQINDSLDDTLVAMQNQLLQTTTVDPQASYGGQVVTDRITVPNEGSLEALLNIKWNDDVYEFRWDVSKLK